MRGLVLWLLWMSYWILLAANAPAFFPEWFQAGMYGFTLGSGIFGGTLAIYASITKARIDKLKEDLERTEKEVTTLKTQAVQAEIPKPASIELAEQLEKPPRPKELFAPGLPEKLSLEQIERIKDSHKQIQQRLKEEIED